MIGFGDHMGTVVEIGMRTTRVRLVTGELLIISNNNLLDKEIRNVTERDRIRLSFVLGVTYETRPETLARIPALLREMGEAENVEVARAGFEAFGSSSLDFTFIVDVPGSDWSVAHPTRNRLLVTIMQRFAAEGINLAYPTQTTYTAAPDGTLVMPYATLTEPLPQRPAEPRPDCPRATFEDSLAPNALPHRLSGFFWNGALRRAEGIYLAAQPAAFGSARPYYAVPMQHRSRLLTSRLAIPRTSPR